MKTKSTVNGLFLLINHKGKKLGSFLQFFKAWWNSYNKLRDKKCFSFSDKWQKLLGAIKYLGCNKTTKVQSKQLIQ